MVQYKVEGPLGPLKILNNCRLVLYMFRPKAINQYNKRVCALCVRSGTRRACISSALKRTLLTSHRHHRV